MTGKHKPGRIGCWGIGCLIYGIALLVLAVSTLAIGERAEEEAGPLAALMLLVWFAGSIPGFILLAQKKYLAWFTALGCIVWLLVGWWAFPLLLVLGPVTWAVALFLTPRRNCPFCRRLIAGNATRCPYCTAEVEPVA
jgi:hypothetical protein